MAVIRKESWFYRRKNPLLLGLLVTWFAVGSLPAQRLNVSHYGTNEGLPQSQVYCIHQDRAGYLWVGTLSGLARFNGKTWRVFNQTDGLVRNHITAIAEDDQGRLWFGSAGGGVVSFDGTRFTRFEGQPVLGQGVVNALLVQASGRVWVGGRQGLAMVYGNETLVFDDAALLPEPHVTALFSLSDDRIMVATPGGALFIDGANGAGTPFSVDLGEVGNVRAVLADPVSSDAYYIGGDHGLVLYRHGVAEQRLTRLLPADVAVTDAAVGTDGTLWFSTLGRGLFRLDRSDLDQRRPGQWISRGNGLSHDVVYALCPDREGNLWIGTDYGLNKLSPGPFLVYRREHGLPDSFVRALYETSDGVIWIGTRNGVATIDADDIKQPLATARLKDTAVYSIGQADEQTMLLGTRGYLAAYALDRDQVTHHDLSEHLQLVRAVHRDDQGRIWLGGEGLGRYQDGRVTPWTRFPSLERMLVMDIESDAQDRLWIATRDRGLFIYDVRADHLENHAAPFTTALWSLSHDGRGGMWLGTNGQGAFYHDGDAFSGFDRRQGLTDPYVWFVYAGEDTVWFGHNRGIDRKQGSDWRNFTTADGLADNEMAVSAVLEDRSGHLWFGSGLGLTRYTPGAATRQTVPARLHLEEAAYFGDGEWRSATAPFNLAPGQHHLRFQYIGVSFRDEQLVRYRYRLVGLDDTWSPETTDTRAVFNGVGSGRFRFEVQCRKAESAWSDSLVFEFSVAPFFYQTLWFKLVLVLTVLVLVGLIHHGRMVRVQNRSKLLAEIVAQRTREVAAKNQELQQLALLDPLTKLHNRRFFDELMPLEEQKLQRQVFVDKDGDSLYQFGFMLVDIDHFCRFNQLHGRDKGDEVLKHFATFLQQTVRSSDVLVRWQNDSFFIFFKDLHRGLLAGLADRVLKMVREHPFTEDGEGCTCSIGYSYYPVTAGEELLGWHEMITLTEQALRLAKQDGRNRAQGIGINHTLPSDHLRWWIREDLRTAVAAGALILVQE